LEKIKINKLDKNYSNTDCGENYILYYENDLIWWWSDLQSDCENKNESSNTDNKVERFHRLYTKRKRVKDSEIVHEFLSNIL